MLKPLLSSSKSWSVCRVGEDGGSSSFLKRSSYEQSPSSLVGNLALTSESRRYILGSTVGYHGWLGEYHFQSHVLVDDIPVFKKSLSYILSSKITVILGVENQTYCCGLKLFFDEVLAVLKIDRGGVLGKFSIIVPSGWKFLHEETFLFDDVSRLLLLLLMLLLLFLFVCLFVFCIADDLTSKETVGGGLRMACMCKNCPVSVFFVWHLMSRIPVSSNRFLYKYSL